MRLYHRVLCVCLLAAAQCCWSSGSANPAPALITSPHQAHAQGLTDFPQLPALSETSSSAGCLSGEVISHNPRDSACAAMCVVIVSPSPSYFVKSLVFAFLTSCYVTNVSLVGNRSHIVAQFPHVLMCACALHVCGCRSVVQTLGVWIHERRWRLQAQAE